VSRNHEKVNPTDDLVSAEILNHDDYRTAVRDSTLVYVKVGLRHDTEPWKKEWHVLIDNVLTACKEHNCKLVFFDNIYMYDKNHLNGMTEETPINPPSQKGKVRRSEERRVGKKGRKQRTR